MPRNDGFDGYREWLGLRNRNRSSDYEILNLAPMESDSGVIQTSIEQKRREIESRRGQGHDDIVDEILARIGEAEVTLLNPDLRLESERQSQLQISRGRRRRILQTSLGILAIAIVGIGALAWRWRVYSEVNPLMEGPLDTPTQVAGEHP